MNVTRIKIVQNARRGLVLMGFVFLDWATPLCAQSNVSPVRLAIVSESNESVAAADLLMVEFSRQPKLQLLERAQIEKAYREQGLSGANKDILKLGQVLAADGLLMLSPIAEGTNQFMQVRLVATKPGAVIASLRSGWPVKDIGNWAGWMTRHFGSLVPKLEVPARDAVAISVVNLRAAVRSVEAQDLERQMTVLTTERLSRERTLFVLERRRLDLLSEEKELAGMGESEFWSGSYLLDGVIDRDGYSPDRVTVDAQLARRGLAEPISFKASGPRSSYGQVVEDLKAKVLEALKKSSDAPPWDSNAEAARYFDEAKWALKWEMFSAAQAASETAWALGERTPAVASLRLNAYSQACLNHKPLNVGNIDCISILAVPPTARLEPMTRALDLFSHGTEFFKTNATDVEWLKLGHRALRTASGILESFYYAAGARADNEAALIRLREASRRTAEILSQGAGTNSLALDRWSDCLEFSWLQWNAGGVWFEHPEDARMTMRVALANGYHPTTLPRLIGWTWEDRKRVPQLQQQFIRELCADTNVSLRLAGKYLALLRQPVAEPGGWQKEKQDLLAAMWEEREWIFRSTGNVSLVSRVEDVLREKKGYGHRDKKLGDEAFTGLRHRLRREYLASVSTYNSLLFQHLFWPPSNEQVTPEEARELLPLAESFAQRAVKPAMSNWIVATFHTAAGTPFTNVASPKPVGPSLSAEAAVVGKFIPWQLTRVGIQPGLEPTFSRGHTGNAKLWFLARYFLPSQVRVGVGKHQSAFIEVDAASGVTQEILFPESRGDPGAFLATDKNLLACVTDKIECYNFGDRKWKTLPVTVEGITEILEVAGHCFLVSRESLLELKPDLQSLEVVASSRRQPAKHELDLIWGSRKSLFGGNHGKLGVVSTNRLWFYGVEDASLKSSPTFPSMGAHYSPTAFAWGEGGLVSLFNQPLMPRHLLAYSVGDTNIGSMLQQRPDNNGRRFGPALVKGFSPPNCDWPEDFPLEVALLAVENRALWALNPRRFSNNSFLDRPEEPVTFTDDRDATLLRFEPEVRQPIARRVRLETNTQKIDPFIASQAGFAPFGWNQARLYTWVATPKGLVLGVPRALGHWLIPHSELEAKVGVQRLQRESLRAKIEIKPSAPASNSAPAKL